MYLNRLSKKQHAAMGIGETLADFGCFLWGLSGDTAQRWDWIQKIHGYAVRWPRGLA